ncbi:MAG: N-acetyltransferase [Pseudomonadaceae bacterium]|nr:MAG: N-acetyltransferase [Pseudomonadaceae bacterium]
MSNPSNIQHDPRSRQFFVMVDDRKAYLCYMDLGKQTLDYYRTFVPPSLRGRGLAAKLTEYALNHAKQSGYTVIPSCSYVERYMQRQTTRSVRSA